MSRYQFGFRKRYSTQQRLLMEIEKWRQSLEKEEHSLHKKFPADLVTFTEKNPEWKTSFFVQ